nr:hypothetical protein BaRGS_022026 [Batillaria attramentaria]
MGLHRLKGLKICGGCSVDAQHEDGIFIKRILPGGLADRQAGLEEGDLILEVNGQGMEGITYDRALSILRQASASDHVELVVTRDEEARSKEVARKMEQDYEEVVALLENEISQLRLQMSKNLKKSESGKKTYEVATDKLLKHLQVV